MTQDAPDHRRPERLRCLRHGGARGGGHQLRVQSWLLIAAVRHLERVLELRLRPPKSELLAGIHSPRVCVCV